MSKPPNKLTAGAESSQDDLFESAMRTSSEVTLLLDQWSAGDQDALPKLMPLIVEDLRNIARKYMAIENPGHTLQPTALVNELYLKLMGSRSVTWRNRAQFFAFVAGMMRRLLVDHARGRRTAKRGGNEVVLSLDETIRLPHAAEDPEIIALDEALSTLAELDPRQARIVELRFFTGLSVNEVAEVEDISPTTVKREWRTARMWLMKEIERTR